MAASGSLYTPVLGLNRAEVASTDIRSYPVAVELENALNLNRDEIDDFAGLVSGSVTVFAPSGSASDFLGDGASLGAAFNRGPDRVIQEVVAFAATSGSGGVTTIDVRVQGTPGNASFTSIFGPVGGPANAAMHVALSSSLGNWGLARSSGFTSGSNTVWKAGSILRAVATTAAGAANASGQRGVTVHVYWAPSGSFPNRTAAP